MCRIDTAQSTAQTYQCSECTPELRVAQSAHTTATTYQLLLRFIACVCIAVLDTPQVQHRSTSAPASSAAAARSAPPSYQLPHSTSWIYTKLVCAVPCSLQHRHKHSTDILHHSHELFNRLTPQLPAAGLCCSGLISSAARLAYGVGLCITLSNCCTERPPHSRGTPAVLHPEQ